MRNCGECLYNNVEIVELAPDGKCPRCGTDYGPEPHELARQLAMNDAREAFASRTRAAIKRRQDES